MADSKRKPRRAFKGTADSPVGYDADRVEAAVREFLLGIGYGLAGGDDPSEVGGVTCRMGRRVDLVQPVGVVARLDRHRVHLTSSSRRTSVAGDLHG